MHHLFSLIFCSAAILFWSHGASAWAKTLVSVSTDKAPTIDGMASDPAWENAPALTTYDHIAKLEIELRSVHTRDKIFILATYPDQDESRDHKLWYWNEAKGMYVQGPEREDVFVFKWNLETRPVDLSINADNPYTADIWFWKACRTDPVGSADDKTHRLTSEYSKHTVKLRSKGGKSMYLLRKGDSGTAAYITKLPTEYEGDILYRFINKTPTGSRADVKAKGVWKDGRWTIEFRRALDTGNDDDVQFDLKRSYQFGVSRYEIAGRKINRKLTQPLYGSGDTGEALTLIFEN